MNADTRSRLISLAVQSEEKAKRAHRLAAVNRADGLIPSAIWWEGLAESAANRAARCREQLENES